MIAKVCDRESRRDSWFENRLVVLTYRETNVTKKDQENAKSFYSSFDFYISL